MDDLGKGEPQHFCVSRDDPGCSKSSLRFRSRNDRCFCAAALSSCAHVKELIRTKQGQFTLEEHALREEQWTLEHIARTMQPCEVPKSRPPSNPSKTAKETETVQ